MKGKEEKGKCEQPPPKKQKSSKNPNLTSDCLSSQKVTKRLRVRALTNRTQHHHNINTFLLGSTGPQHVERTIKVDQNDARAISPRRNEYRDVRLVFEEEEQ